MCETQRREDSTSVLILISLIMVSVWPGFFLYKDVYVCATEYEMDST